MTHLLVVVVVSLLINLQIIVATPAEAITTLVRTKGVSTADREAAAQAGFDVTSALWPVKYTFTDIDATEFEVTMVLVPKDSGDQWLCVIPPMAHAADVEWLKDANNVNEANAKNGIDYCLVILNNSPDGWAADLAWLSGHESVGITGWGYARGIAQRALRLANDFVKKCEVDVAQIHDGQHFPCIKYKGIIKKYELKGADMMAGRIVRVFQGKPGTSIYESGGYKYKWHFAERTLKRTRTTQFNEWLTAIRRYTIAAAGDEIADTYTDKAGIISKLTDTGKDDVAGAIKHIYTADCKNGHEAFFYLFFAILGVEYSPTADRYEGLAHAMAWNCNDRLKDKEHKNFAELVKCWFDITQALELHGINGLTLNTAFYKETVVDQLGVYAAQIDYYNEYDEDEDDEDEDDNYDKMDYQNSVFNNYGFGHYHNSESIPTYNEYYSYKPYSKNVFIMVAVSLIVLVMCSLYIIINICICIACFLFGKGISNRTANTEKLIIESHQDEI